MIARMLAPHVIVVVAIVTPCRSVFADATEARRHYQQGVTAYNLQKFSTALEEFQAAYVAKQDPVFLYNIGQAQRNLGQYEAAAKSYRAFLNQSPDVSSSQRDEIAQLIKQMDDAARDERAKQPPTGTKAPEPSQTPVPSAAPPPVATSPTPTPPSTRGADVAELHAARTKRIAGLAVAGFGVVAVGLGGAFTGLANDANRHIVSGDTWSPSKESSRNTYQALDVAFFAVGGAAIATGLVLYLVGRHDERRRYPVEHAQLAPAVEPSLTGLNVAGRF